MQFELVPADEREEIRMLVNATSEHGERGIALLSHSQMDASQNNGCKV